MKNKKEQPDVDQMIAEYLRQQVPVYLYLNDEAGIRQWSVAVCGNAEFWLASFPTKKEAQGYCRKHRLPIKGIIRQQGV